MQEERKCAAVIGPIGATEGIILLANSRTILYGNAARLKDASLFLQQAKYISLLPPPCEV
jgi:hypothetical protein